MFQDVTYGSDRGLIGFFDWLQPLADLLVRVILAFAFYVRGVSKVASEEAMSVARFDLRYPVSLTPTDATLALFESEYALPLVAPAWHAQLSVIGEICFPILLVLGLFGRFAALGLLAISIALALSYLPPISSGARYLTLLWSAMLLIVVTHGPGKISFDHWFARFRN